MADLKDSREPIPGRVTRAAVVGGGLAFGCVVVALVVVAMVPCHAEGWDCLGNALLAIFGGLVLAAVSAWPVLHLVRVRPALPVAVCGPLATGAIAWFSAKAPLSGGIAYSGWFVEATLGYGVAAFVTAGAVNWRWRVSVALLVACLIPLGGWINARRIESAHARELPGAAVTAGERSVHWQRPAVTDRVETCPVAIACS